MKAAVRAFALIAWASLLSGQSLQRGDVVVTAFTPQATSIQSNLLVFGSDGVFKWQLTGSDQTLHRETLFHNGVLYVGTNFEIKRFTPEGAELTRFNSADAINHLSPVGDGSLVGSNGSGEIYHFNDDGSLRSALRVSTPGSDAAGVDVSADRCSIYFAGLLGLAVWNSCVGGPPVRLGTQWSGRGFGAALRQLPDGGFLVAHLDDITRLDSAGNVVRRYGIPGSALGLDLNGRSFWTGVAGTLVKASIETGQLEQLVPIGQSVQYISIVGERRPALAGAAAIPTVSQAVLVLLALTLLGLAWVRVR